MKDLVEKIRALCRANPNIKSITRLEEILGFGNGAIGKWAKSDKFPPYDRVNAVANALGVTVSYLTGEEHKENPDLSKEIRVTDEDMKHLAAFHAADEDTKAAIRLLLAKFENGEE